MRILLTGCMALTLVGCAQTTQQIPTIPHEARVQHFNGMQQWQVEGKVGVRNAEEGHNVNMHWQQDGSKYSIRFFSSFTTDSATLTGNDTSAELKTSDGKIYQSNDPTSLLKEHLGWSIPFGNLRYWIKGQAAPQSKPSSIQFDKHNQLVSLQQDGWLVDYQEYKVLPQITLPSKMTLTDGTTTVKLVIHDWKK